MHKRMRCRQGDANFAGRGRLARLLGHCGHGASPLESQVTRERHTFVFVFFFSLTGLSHNQATNGRGSSSLNLRRL